MGGLPGIGHDFYFSKGGGGKTTLSVELGAVATDEQGNLYAGGNFNIIGDVITPGIAQWNGTKWLPLGAGLMGDVSTLAVCGNDVYVGGYFTAPVGGAANSAVQIARWNGAWSAVGSGMVVTQPGDSMQRAVFALSPNPSGDLLYAGGFCEVYPHTVGVAGYLMGYHFVPPPNP